ncbi:MAG: hypothetical protein HY459_01950 [Parcubacteria group bacterium]|nr:hypothetical protein [Parcubacteria group bacterium]
MDQERWKLGSACFAGGSMAVLLFFMVAPFWGVALGLLIGTIVGALVGYFSYEWRETISAVKVAAPGVAWALTAGGKGLYRFFSRPRPFFYLVVGGTFFGALLTINALENIADKSPGGAHYPMLILLWALYSLVAGGLGGHAGIVKIALSTERNTQKWAQRVDEYNSGRMEPIQQRKRLVWMLGSISDEFPLTHALLYFDALIVIVKWTAVTFFWTVPRGIVRFFWFLFRQIHSNRRTICMVDGPIGFWATYVILRLRHGADFLTFPLYVQFSYVILGGMIAVGIGLVNYELISKHWLKTIPVATLE